MSENEELVDYCKSLKELIHDVREYENNTYNLENMV